MVSNMCTDVNQNESSAQENELKILALRIYEPLIYGNYISWQWRESQMKVVGNSENDVLAKWLCHKDQY